MPPPPPREPTATAGGSSHWQSSAEEQSDDEDGPVSEEGCLTELPGGNTVGQLDSGVPDWAEWRQTPLRGSPPEHAPPEPHTFRTPLPPMQVVVGFVEEQELMHDELRSQLPMSFGEKGSIYPGRGLVVS